MDRTTKAIILKLAGKVLDRAINKRTELHAESIVDMIAEEGKELNLDRREVAAVLPMTLEECLGVNAQSEIENG